jgi:ABC-2 type transport system permease protein
MTRLIHSEWLKIRTTNPWWIFGIAVVVTTGLALVLNCIQADSILNAPPPEFGNETDPQIAAQAQAEYAAQRNVATQAANIFTSGQYFGALFVMLLGILLITNEFYHQTATTTFLVTPHRTRVVVAKLITGMLAAGVVWLVCTAIDLVVGVIFFNAQGLNNQLGTWAVQRALLFNLMVFALWAVLGVGFGALIRSQIGATITASVLYVVAAQVVQGLFNLAYYFWIKQDWVLTAQVVVPSVAAQIFVSPVKLFPQSPPYWVGGLVLLAYGAVAGTIGTLIIRRRDIS